MIVVTPWLSIPEREIALSAVRASGPGGQNVNKTATAVELRFDVRRSPSLPADVALRLMRVAGRRLTKEGVLVLAADAHRSQEMNRRAALDRLTELLREAARPPPPKRRATRPTKAASERRLQAKTARGAVKRSRAERPAGD